MLLMNIRLISKHAMVISFFDSEVDTSYKLITSVLSENAVGADVLAEFPDYPEDQPQ